MIKSKGQMLANFDKTYFDNYGSSGQPYDKTYRNFGFTPNQMLSNYKRHNLLPKSLLDCGCATGKTVGDFRKLGVSAYGLEISEYAYNKIPDNIKEFCWLFDMRNLNKLSANAFDSIYANSLMYLTEQEIKNWLDAAYKVARSSIYICNPLTDYPSSIPKDPARKTLQSKQWWFDTCEKHGFVFCRGTDMLFRKI